MLPSPGAHRRARLAASAAFLSRPTVVPLRRCAREDALLRALRAFNCPTPLLVLSEVNCLRVLLHFGTLVL
jgi:hypothetical protein